MRISAYMVSAGWHSNKFDLSRFAFIYSAQNAITEILSDCERLSLYLLETYMEKTKGTSLTPARTIDRCIPQQCWRINFRLSIFFKGTGGGK